MRTARILLAVFSFTFLASMTGAKEISFYGSVGYGLNRGGNYFISSSAEGTNGIVTSITDHYLNLGKGIKFNGDFQIRFNPALALRLGAQYSIMTPLEVRISETLQEDNISYQSHMIDFHSILIFNAAFGNYHPYLGAGAGLFFSSLKSVETGGYYSGDHWEYKMEETYQPAIGIIGLLGIEFLQSKTLKPFVELNFQQVSFTQKKIEVTSATMNGENIINEIDIDTYTPGLQTSVSPEANNPASPPPLVRQASSVGLRLGVKFNF